MMTTDQRKVAERIEDRLANGEDIFDVLNDYITSDDPAESNGDAMYGMLLDVAEFIATHKALDINNVNRVNA